MKLFISFFISAQVMASPIRIYHESIADEARSVKEIFVNEYSIPEDLITLRVIERCEDLKVKGKLDLCLKNNGDLLMVSAHSGFIQESLKIFQAP